MSPNEYWLWFRDYVTYCIRTDKFGNIHPAEPRKRAATVFGLKTFPDIMAWQKKNQAKITKIINQTAKPFGLRIAKGNKGYTKLETIPSKKGVATPPRVILQGLRLPGTRLFFEYHCFESDESADAKLWHRSHQKVTVIGVDATCDGLTIPTKKERGEAGMPLVYNIRFDDGYIGAAFEDELLNSENGYTRPAPPKSHVQ